MIKRDKTLIKAEIILASKNAVTGDVLTTFRLTYPRFLLSEFNTHRCMSRNTSSSRAIPMKTVRKTVINDPFLPLYIGAAQKGMQAGEEIEGWRRWAIEKAWQYGRYPAVALHWALDKLGAPKQITNRVLEPWLWTTQVVSATDWKNFLLLRTHQAAEPHFRFLASYIEHLLNTTEWIFANKLHKLYSGTHQILQPNEWHLPFVTEVERNECVLGEQKCISAARAARTSYTLIGSKEPDTEKDIELGESLMKQRPLHASPLEHLAQALENRYYMANFRGFEQWRKQIKDEDGGDRG